MKIIFGKEERALKKIKGQLELAEIITNGPDQIFDKDLAIRQLNAAIRDIFTIIGI